jgi:hypothetical protein
MDWLGWALLAALCGLCLAIGWQARAARGERRHNRA